MPPALDPPVLDAPARTAFARAARQVRTSLVARAAAWATLAAASVACVVVALGRGARVAVPWPLLVALPALALGAFAWQGTRRRWSDADVASYLDARLGLPETLLSWVHAPADPTLGDAVVRALAARSRAPRPVVLTRRWAAASALVLAATVALVGLPARTPAAEPLSTAKRAAPAPSLAALEGLRDLPLRDEAEQRRRVALVAEAARLDADLRRGLARDEAQARLGAIRDTLAEERRRLGGAHAASGLDAAARALEARGAGGLAEALAQRDLVGFDAELERLASARERVDRASARRALQEAAAAARAAGAGDVGTMLEQSAAAVAERAQRADALRAFADAVRRAGGSEELAQSAERLGRPGNRAEAEAAADALAQALATLDESQRQQLAENLATLQREGGASGAPSGEAARPIDPRALAEELRRLAHADVKVDEAERDRALRDAEGQLERAGDELRGIAPGGGAGAGQASGPPGGGGAGASGAGASGGGGPGAHEGSTAPVAAAELRARARGGAAASTAGTHWTVTGAGGAGERPLRESPAAVRAQAARELSTLDDGELPAEYREQVRRYFSP